MAYKFFSVPSDSTQLPNLLAHYSLYCRLRSFLISMSTDALVLCLCPVASCFVFHLFGFCLHVTFMPGLCSQLFLVSLNCSHPLFFWTPMATYLSLFHDSYHFVLYIVDIYVHILSSPPYNQFHDVREYLFHIYTPQGTWHIVFFPQRFVQWINNGRGIMETWTYPNSFNPIRTTHGAFFFFNCEISSLFKITYVCIYPSLSLYHNFSAYLVSVRKIRGKNEKATIT